VHNPRKRGNIIAESNLLPQKKKILVSGLSAKKRNKNSRNIKYLKYFRNNASLAIAEELIDILQL